VSAARFVVVGTFDLAAGLQKATVLVDRVTGIFSVRPFRRKRAYELPLATVAALVCQMIVRAEVREKKAARRARRRSS
jgi:hypothetical protein